MRRFWLVLKVVFLADVHAAMVAYGVWVLKLARRVFVRMERLAEEMKKHA